MYVVVKVIVIQSLIEIFIEYTWIDSFLMSRVSNNAEQNLTATSKPVV